MVVSRNWLIGMGVLLAAFGGYVLTSLILLRFPTLIHTKKKPKFKCRHISHRGGAGENLENTMAAFQHAVNNGTDMLEIDCHLTRDGQVVVSHDNSLRRTTGHDIKISETDYKDLPHLRDKLKLDFSQDSECCGGDDKRIPLLREIFERFPHLPINIDIKINDDELVQKVAEMVEEFKRVEYTVWGNVNNVVTEKCYSTNSNIAIFFSLRRVVVLVLMFYTGLLPFMPLRESFYEIMMPSVLLKEGKFHTKFSRRAKLLLRICDSLLMSPVMFRHLRRRGIQTYLWVLNEEDEWERAFRCGATGVMTDFPTSLYHFLQEHPDYGS